MKKRAMAVLLGVIICVMTLFAEKIPCMAAPVEIGVTTLADAAYFNQDWAGRSLIICYGEKSWIKPVAELMNQEMRITMDNGVKACSFVQSDWTDEFLKTVNTDLRSSGIAYPGLPEGCCYQLLDGFKAWYLNVLQTQLISGPANDFYVTLNENTCKVTTYAEAEAASLVSVTDDYVLAGTCTTSFKGTSANRINNVRVSSERLNGYVLPSGACASLDAIFMPRTSANGYKKAGTYVGGRIVEGLGGGICQVSSTAYNALMNAGVTVTMRYPHSSPVTYLPLGMDAAISAGSKDLQFRNDYPNPIKFETIVEGTKLTVNVYVKSSDLNGVSYKLWAKKLSSMSAKTYQSVYINGVEAEVREIGTCRYQPLKEDDED